MATTFGAKARAKIREATIKTLDTVAVPAYDRRYAPDILQRMSPGGGSAFPLSIGKAGYGGIAASSTDWETRSFGPVTLFGFHANRSNTPEENTGAGQGANPSPLSFDAESDRLWGAYQQPTPNRQNGGIVMAWNPGCSHIAEGSPVVMGQDAMGNYIVIFEMCPCGDY